MKRIGSAVLTAALVLSLSLPAAAASAGSVVGHIYATDIVAQIDGHPLRSYNLGDATLVVAEDLREYGFAVIWDGEARTLTVERLPENAVTGTYQPPAQTQAVGTRVGNIYATDIKTYVQGAEVESYNIGGETAIRFSELGRTGTFAWSQETRLSALTLAQDPMEFALDQKEEKLKEAGLSYTFERYPSSNGTLVVCGQNGTPHGSACSIDYVAQNGAVVSVTELLPSYGFGAAYYIHPRDIHWNGVSFTFLTPVKAAVNGQDEDWGDCLCEFHPGSRTLQVTRLGTPLEDWWAGSSYEAGETDPDAPLTMTITRAPGAYEASVEEENLPSESISVSMSRTGIILNHSAGFLNLTGEEDWASTPYKQAFEALAGLGLPSVVQENFSQTNSQELREQAGQWFQVTLNGAPVSGDLWWSQGNNHRDLNFTFDQPISLSEGDVITLWVGMPNEP